MDTLYARIDRLRPLLAEAARQGLAWAEREFGDEGSASWEMVACDHMKFVLKENLAGLRARPVREEFRRGVDHRRGRDHRL